MLIIKGVSSNIYDALVSNFSEIVFFLNLFAVLKMEKLTNVPGIFVTGNESLDIFHMKHELEKKKKLYNSVNLSRLPDNGARIKHQIDKLEEALKTLSLETNDQNNKSSRPNTLKDNDGSVCKIKTTSVSIKKEKSEGGRDHGESKGAIPKKILPFSEQSDVSGDKPLSFKDLSSKQTGPDFCKNYANSPSFKSYREPKPKKTGHTILLTDAKPLVEKAVSRNKMQYCFTTSHYLKTDDECAKKMHNLLVTYPDDSKQEAEPENLRSSLMMHQKKGLAWLMWREQQDPSGGILADDMGLGKTLTMISLILKQKETNNYISFKEDKFECRGTLIVCVASIIHQWGDEINKHCENDALKVYLYHGSQRNKSFKKMMEFDVVLTTYDIVRTENTLNNFENGSPLFKLKWERVVLDEAHTIKRDVTQTAKAIFDLKAFRRWAVTGTPIHNVFKDVYSLVKFLRFSPFDDKKKFKELTDDNSELNTQRRSLLVKSIVLRRTKEQVDKGGKPLIEMKKKSISMCYIELSDEERLIYEKLNKKITKKFNQYLELRRSNNDLLVLLLRLQQCCNHLSLLKNETEEPDDPTDISNIMSSLTITKTTSNSSETVSNSESSLNITFNDLETDKLDDPKVKSSKIKELFKKLHEISKSSGKKDKSVIVSQWVSMLKIVEHHLKQENIDYHMIAGNTKVLERQKLAEDFNYNKDGAKIMLLSLKAGGVGLNLIGANHLFLMDLHWNPALEMQACDRIHRVGQEKDVVIHKFICKETIEERIKSLQDIKSGIASSALCGIKQNTSGLTIEDFKMLFSVKKY